MGTAGNPDGPDGGQDGPDAASRGDPAMHKPRLRTRTVEGNRTFHSWHDAAPSTGGVVLDRVKERRLL